MSIRTRIANPGDTIRLTVSFYKNGVLFEPYSISDVKIYDDETGGTLITTLTPVSNITGVYYVDYPIPLETPPDTVLFDEWTWQATVTLAQKVIRYNFLVGIVGGTSEGGSYTSVASGIGDIEARLQMLEGAYSDILSLLNTKVVMRPAMLGLVSIFNRQIQELQNKDDELDTRLSVFE